MFKLYERIRGYQERRSALKAADALHYFMVMNGHKINNDEYDALCRMRGYLIERS